MHIVIYRKSKVFPFAICTFLIPALFMKITGFVHNRNVNSNAKNTFGHITSKSHENSFFYLYEISAQVFIRTKL